MRLKTFTAPNLQHAMQMVRDTMGEDAVILSTAREAGGKNISVTAAYEAAEEKKQKTVQPSTQSYASHILSRQQQVFLREVEKIFLFHGTPEYLAEKILHTAQYLETAKTTQPDNHPMLLAKVLEAVFTFAPLDTDSKGQRIILVGPPGIGKTVTVAKIAAAGVLKKKPVTVITTDDKRAGGVEQLSSLTRILGLTLQVATSRANLKSLLDDISPNSRVVIDSAGSNPYIFEELKELSKFATLEGVEPVLVAAAGGDSTEAEEIARAFAFLGAKRLLVTRTDSAKRFGSILATATAANLSFCNMSGSAQIASDLQKLDASRLAALLIKHRVDLKP